MAKKGDVIENPRTGQQMKFIQTGLDTNGELLQIDCINAPTGVKEPEHIHPFQENRFEILSGSMMLRIGGKERQVNAGEVVSIPPNTPHFFWNGSDREVHYIQEFRPALHIDAFFETLFSLARDGKLNDQGKPGLFQMAALIPRFWNVIRVTQPPQPIQKVFFKILGPISRSLGY